VGSFRFLLVSILGRQKVQQFMSRNEELREKIAFFEEAIQSFKGQAEEAGLSQDQINASVVSMEEQKNELFIELVFLEHGSEW
jgi:cell division septum initiation protein DivIVA